MAIREKLRKTFRKKDSGSSSSGGSTPSTGSSDIHYTGRTDIEYYKPHEIPKSKYKGKVDPEHRERLESYSFADAFNTVRRKSSQALSGIMSPGGTKAQSRRPSYVSHVSHMSRRRSIASVTGPHEEGLHRVSTIPGHPAPLIRENSDDDTDVVNAGRTRMAGRIPELKLERQATADVPFTAEELEKAMTRATIRPDNPMSGSMAIAAH